MIRASIGRSWAVCRCFEQGLNDANVLATLEQMGRKAVAKRMQRDRLAQPRGVCGLLEQSTELTRGHWLMLTAAWSEGGLSRPRFSGWGSPALPLFSQPATGLSALAPAQRAGAQRLCALAPNRLTPAFRRGP